MALSKKLDDKKFKLSLKPINMMIIEYLEKHQMATSKAIIEHNQSFSQASIYRAIHELLEANIIAIEKEEKVHSVLERYFKLTYNVSEDIHDKLTQKDYDKLLAGVNIWMGTITQELQDYLNDWLQTDDPIRFGMGKEILHLTDDDLIAFYREFYQLLEKYKAYPKKENAKNFSISASWVPLVKGDKE